MHECTGTLSTLVCGSNAADAGAVSTSPNSPINCLALLAAFILLLFDAFDELFEMLPWGIEDVDLAFFGLMNLEVFIDFGTKFMKFLTVIQFVPWSYDRALKLHL